MNVKKNILKTQTKIIVITTFVLIFGCFFSGIVTAQETDLSNTSINVNPEESIVDVPGDEVLDEELKKMEELFEKEMEQGEEEDRIEREKRMEEDRVEREKTQEEDERLLGEEIERFEEEMGIIQNDSGIEEYRGMPRALFEEIVIEENGEIKNGSIDYIVLLNFKKIIIWLLVITTIEMMLIVYLICVVYKKDKLQ